MSYREQRSTQVLKAVNTSDTPSRERCSGRDMSKQQIIIKNALLTKAAHTGVGLLKTRATIAVRTLSDPEKTNWKIRSIRDLPQNRQWCSVPFSLKENRTPFCLQASQVVGCFSRDV